MNEWSVIASIVTCVGGVLVGKYGDNVSLMGSIVMYFAGILVGYGAWGAG